MNKLLIAFSLCCVVLFCGMSCEDGCETEVNIPVEYKYIETYNIDNGGAISKITFADSVPKAAYGININIFAEIKDTIEGDCTEYYNEKDVLYFKIFTLDDFNPTHLSGSDISEYIVVMKHNTSYEPFNKNTTGIITKKSYGSSSMQPISIDVLLMETPTVGKSYRFKVEIMYADSTTLADTTKSIVLF